MVKKTIRMWYCGSLVGVNVVMVEEGLVKAGLVVIMKRRLEYNGSCYVMKIARIF